MWARGVQRAMCEMRCVRGASEHVAEDGTREWHQSRAIRRLTEQNRICYLFRYLHNKAIKFIMHCNSCLLRVL